jgi:hypothetical protein
MGAAPRLQVIDADASPEEVAAIVAAVTAALGAGAPAGEPEPEAPSRWVTAARLWARGTGASRSDWRTSGRMGRAPRA